METGGRQEIDLDFEAHDLVDIHQFSEDVNAEAKAGIDVNDNFLEGPELHESTEPKQNRRKGRFNPRESIAWNSAFSTDAGVLDAEELSNMMPGADKSEKSSLHGIEEEITRSTESLSTLASDSLTLEACEDDLFLDIRASIQRSSKKASNLRNPSSKKAPTEIDNMAISSLKKEEAVPQDKNPKLGLKKISTLQAVRMSKCQPKQIGKLGSGKPIKQDSVHSQVSSIAKVGGTKSILPQPPKTVITSIPSSTASAKRESTGTVRLKSGSSSKPGTTFSKGTQPSKMSMLSGTRNVLPRPVVPSKSSLLSSSTTSSVHSTRSSTSSDCSTNTSSGIPAKSTIMTARRNLGKTSNVGPPASISKIPSRAPLRVAPNNKLPALKISSSVSPSSSISEWSPASSSSSMANQRSSCNSRASLDIISCKSMDSGPTAEKHGKQGVLLANNASKKSSTQAGGLQAPAKPSGLRMPSPSIGFFDGVKSPARTPNGLKQSEPALRTAFPKSGNTLSIPIRSSNSKQKSARVSTPKTGSSLANIKPVSPKPALPLPSQENLHASIVSKDVNDCSNLSFGAKGSAIEDICQKAEKVQAEDGIKQVVGLDTSAIDDENFGDSSMCKSLHSEDNIKSISGSENVDQIGENIPINQDQLKKDSESHSICEAGDDIKIVSGSEYADHLGDFVLLSQDQLKKDSESDPICEAGDDIKTAFGSEYVDQMVVNVPLNHDHLEKDSELHSICEAGNDIKTVSGLENADHMRDNVPINGDHLKDSESHPICDDIKAVSDSGGDDVLLNQDHLEKDSELHPVCEAGDNINIVSGPEQMGDNVLIKQDPLKNDSKSHPTLEDIDQENDRRGVHQNILGLTCELQSDTFDCLGDSVLLNQDHLEKDFESDHPVCEAGDNINIVSGPEQMGDNVLIKQDPLKNDSKSHPTFEDIDKENDRRGVYQNVQGLICELQRDTSDCVGDNVLLNQDHLKDSESHPICEAEDDINAISLSEYVDCLGDNEPLNQNEKDSELLPIGDDIKTVSGSEYVDQMVDNALINGDHLKKEHPICESGDVIKIVSSSEYVSQLGDHVLLNQDHLKKDFESHPICEAPGDDIMAVSVSEYVDHFGDNQDHLKKDSKLHPTCEAIETVSASEYVDQMEDNALINHDHQKDSDSHPICETADEINAVSGSEYVNHLGDSEKDSELHLICGSGDDIKTISVSDIGDNVQINQDRCLEKDLKLHPICEDIKTVSGSDMGDNALINHDRLEKDSNSHPICETADDINAVSGSEHVNHLGDNEKDYEFHLICGAGDDIKTISISDIRDNVQINQDRRLEKDSELHPICEDIKTVSGSDMGDNALINHDHLEKDSDSHPICETADDINAVAGSEYVNHLGDNEKDSELLLIYGAGDDIKTISVSDIGDNVQINQDRRLEKDSELHPNFEDIKTVSGSDMGDNAPIKQDHLEKDSESHPICDAGDDTKTVSGSEYVDHVGDNVPNNQDDLEKGSELHPISEDIKTVCGSENFDQMGDNVKKDMESHPIFEDEGNIKIVSGPEHVDSKSHPTFEDIDKENDRIGVYQNVPDCTHSFPAACRAPLTLKNTSENVPNELVIQVDKTGFVVPSSEQKENI